METKEYQPITHSHPYHGSSVRLPDSLKLDNVQPLGIFSLFFNAEQLDIIVTNTNAYGSRHRNDDWNLVTLNEIKIWTGMIIYMGVNKASSLRDYWNKNTKHPIHSIQNKITRRRFELVKRYIHISHPDADIDSYYDKMEPLMSHVRETSKKYYIPDSKVSVDEMMVRFSGRSGDTVRMKGKRTPQGFKIVSLCDSGFTYTFVPTSRLKKCNVPMITGVNYIGSVVTQLITQLRLNGRSFDVYMDSYFTSFKLFQYLRDMDIGACGTVKRSIITSLKERC